MPKVATTIDAEAVLAGLDTVDYDAVDRAVLDAAAMLMVAEGLAGVEVDVVASRAGVARSTVYRRFGSRNELLAATLAYQVRRFFAGLAADVDGIDDVADRVADAFARGLTFARLAGLTDLIRREPLLLQLLTVDGNALIHAARTQLVTEAQRRAPHLDPAVVGDQAEILVRLALSYVVTPPRATGEPGDAGELVLVDTVRRMVRSALT